MFMKPVGEFGFIPTRISNCVLWLDAADPSVITASGGKVSQWNDKSGSGNNATQATGANQPSTNSATINGVNALSFNGTAAFMQLPSGLYSIPNGSNTSFIVRTPTAAPASPNSARILNAQNGGTGRYFTGLTNPSGTTNSNYENNASNAGAIVGAVYSTNTIVDVFTVSGATQTVYQNGVSQGTNGSATTFTATQFNIGCQTTTPNNLFTGSIAEIVLYNAALSHSNLNLVGAYLAAKWGVSWTTI